MSSSPIHGNTSRSPDTITTTTTIDHSTQRTIDTIRDVASNIDNFDQFYALIAIKTQMSKE